MTDAEIFNCELIHHRLGMPLEILPENAFARKAYDNLRNLSGRLITSAKDYLPLLPDIHFDFVLHEDINAFAFKTDGRYFIGLNTGTIFMLELVFTRMLSDSRLFNMVGNPNEESNDLPSLIGYIPKAKKMFNAGQRPILPRTQKRLSYAEHLIEQAILFLVGHEIAHIVLGHVDYLQSKNGAALIAEMGWNESDPEGAIERQCLEAQADMRSVFAGIASLQLTHTTPNSQKPSWADSTPKEGRLIFDWALAMNSLFRLFGDAKFTASQLATESYPPLPLRRAMATDVAYGAVMANWDPALKEKSSHALRTAMQYTEHAFATILGKDLAVEGLKDAFSLLGKGHRKRLFEHSFGLQKRLAPFAYEEMFALVPKCDFQKSETVGL